MKYIIILLLTTFSYSQSVFNDEQFNFGIQEPVEWIKAEKNESLKNLKEKIKFSDEKINELIEKSKGTFEIVTFYKYPTNSVNGVIPTIKVNLRKNPANSISSFKKMMDNSIANIKLTFPKLIITEEPTLIKLNGKDCVYFESINIIPTKFGNEEVKTITYAVPVGGNFFQINFMDTKKDNNQKMFSELLNTIRL